MIATVPVELTDAVLAAEVVDGLALVEKELADATRSEEELLAEASTHLLEAGGKRFRATLVLLASHFGNARDPRVVSAATAVELTHLATLYHDDVMDEAVIRRGHQSANSRWTNTIAILTGDFLFARASQMLAALGAEAVGIQADTFARLVGGQIAETIGPPPGQDPLQHYLHVVKDKTASLVATAWPVRGHVLRCPGRGGSPDRAACEAIGVAWQLSDDILDVASESDQSGKTPGTDLREGIRSLPVLHALGSSRPGDARLRDLLTAADLTDPGLHAEALGLLRANPAMQEAQADLRRWAAAAREQIAGLPDVPARAAFEGLCDYVVKRTG